MLEESRREMSTREARASARDHDRRPRGRHGHLRRLASRRRLAAVRPDAGVRHGSAGRPALRALRRSSSVPGPAEARATGQDRAGGTAALRPGGGHGVRRRSARSASRPGCRCSGSSSPRSRLAAAFLNAAFDSASVARCTFSFKESGQPSWGRAAQGGFSAMSRSDVLVDADWVEAQIGAPGIVIVEVDEDTSAYDKGHIPSAIKIDWKKDLQDPVRRDFVDKVGLRGAALRARHLQRRHRGALRRQQQLVRRLRLLVLQAVRARTTCCCSTAAARSGSSTPAS